MHTILKQRIISLAESSLNEICGFVYSNAVGRPALFECKNISADPQNEFDISDEDHIAALQAASPFEPLAVYHSHPAPRSSGFSEADLDYAHHIYLPQYLYDVGGKEWHEYIPSDYQVELAGRPFALGIEDCYSLVRHYFRQNFSHYMSDYDRDETFSHEEAGTIMASFQREGFRLGSLDSLAMHDVMMFKTDKALPQHFGVYMGSGNLFLHHPQHGLSRTELLTDRWLSRLVCVFKPDFDTTRPNFRVKRD
jgi:proteasome lid subunit RPN8/RPN11